MKHESIAEIYEANDLIRSELKNLVGSLSAEQLEYLPEGEKWTIAQIVEHLAVVESGIAKISARLLKAAQEKGGRSDGKPKISREFLQKALEGRDKKLEAPEMVQPKGGVSIAESFAKMEETRKKLEEIRPLFESVDETEFKFPHPAFGDLTSHEWLVLIGGHESRHIGQIKRILDKIDKNAEAQTN